MRQVRVLAPAKVNLALRVAMPRPDGYHPLETVFESLDLFDEIVVTEVRGGSGGIGLRIEGEGADALPTGSDNLVVRAAEALRAKAGRADLGADIVVRKSIPVAGGMAGGSADAAGTLVALDALWGLGSDASDLHEIARRLGSDVPFCLLGGLALGRGRGEELVPLSTGTMHSWVFLTNPVGLSTPEVFREFDRLTGLADGRKTNAAASDRAPGEPTPPAWAAGGEAGTRPAGKPASTRELRDALAGGDVRALAPHMVNDLQIPAFSLRPDLEEIARQVGMGVATILSGSGPTIAVLAEDATTADALAGRFARQFPELRVVRANGPASGAHVVGVADAGTGVANARKAR